MKKKRRNQAGVVLGLRPIFLQPQNPPRPLSLVPSLLRRDLLHAVRLGSCRAALHSSDRRHREAPPNQALVSPARDSLFFLSSAPPLTVERPASPPVFPVADCNATPPRLAAVTEKVTVASVPPHATKSIRNVNVGC